MMDVVSFGKELLRTNDLDPVYNLVWESGLSGEALQKWLLAYWGFYHMGTACWIASSPNFWESFKTAAGSRDYPRNRERRHYRGKNAIDSVAFLERTGLTTLFTPFNGKRPMSFRDAYAHFLGWTGYGPWMAFKASDMVDRVGLRPIIFDSRSPFLFDSPKEGAIRMWEEAGKPSIPSSGASVETWAIETLMKELRSFKAPPRYERAVGVQEAETVLCKWKSYLNGHYHIGEDIKGCRENLLRFSKVPLSQQILRAGKRAELW